MTTVADMELGFARLSAMLGPCAHPDAVPVDLLVTGETVAWLCPACDVQLPADWVPLSRKAPARAGRGECDCRQCREAIRARGRERHGDGRLSA